MNIGKIAIVVVCVFLSFALIHRIAKNKKPFKRAFLSLLCGPIAMSAVNLIGGFFDIGIPVSILSLLISCFGGIPGVTAILVLNLFF